MRTIAASKPVPVRTTKIRLLFVSAALLLTGLAASAEPSPAPLPSPAALAPSVVRERAASLDGTPVTVGGKIEDYEVRHTLIGTISNYDVCDEKCVTVLIKSDPRLANAQQTTASGTFHALLVFYGHKIPNVITVGF